MPVDKWDKYAEPASGGDKGDKWAQYAEPTTEFPAPPGTPSLASAPGGPKSQPQPEEVNLLTGKKPLPAGHLAHEVAGVVTDSAAGAAHMAAAVPVTLHRTLQKYDLAPKGDLFPGEHTQQQVKEQDVPNMALTGLSMAPEAMEGAAAGAEAATPRGRTVPKPPSTVAEPLPPEQAAAVEKANRGYQSAKAQIERRTELQQTSKRFVERAHDNIQRTYATARGSLDQRWGQFRQGMEGAELSPTDTFNAIEAAKAKYLRGSPSSLTQFNNLAKEMGIQEFMEGAGGELKAIPGSGKLPFDTARVHYSAIGDKLAQGDLPGNVYQALKAVKESLDQQLSKAAESRNLGKQYSSLKADESQFRDDWVDPKSPLARARKALDPNFLEPQLLGRGNEYITKQLERYKPHGAKPELGAAARHYADQAKELGSKKLPEVKELPTPKPAAKGGMARKAARIGGKLVGGAAGSAMGHPFLGYAVGGEAGTELYDRATRPKTVPSPPRDE